jgi:Endodeoxyribonuclease RusA
MIRLELPWLPPSSNNAYFNLKRGGRTLTDDGRSFLTRTKAHLAQKYPSQMKLFRKNKPFMLLFRFYFEELENKGFAEGKAKSRYKVFDGGNRTKLLEDALKDAGGIDDSQTLTSTWQKERGTPERTIIWAWSLEEEATPFDEFLRALQ